ncbi:hypothetical protein CCACVL1_11811 [Corchorus capsularis]|uniref:Uncharacterized protein n=2 Tax=Corchorus TaxID=93758 RepID=A0A1R3IJB7_COCAP|nr:hypothetical protein COLO4_34755 [Corchorus olitorius]OMO82688.1 hypothetical protein CCACVL1_11811 [Corchorus capsularis]
MEGGTKERSWINVKSMDGFDQIKRHAVKLSKYGTNT